MIRDVATSLDIRTASKPCSLNLEDNISSLGKYDVERGKYSYASLFFEINQPIFGIILLNQI